MPKVIKATDPITIKTLCVLVYGQPGVGKTTLGLSAESPLLLDFDGGAHRAGLRANSIPIESWEDALDLLDPSKLDDELKQILSVSKTIVIDTMGKLQDYLIDYIIRNDYKMQNKAGGLTLPGYGALGSAFQQFLSRIRLMGKDIVIIAHDKEDKDGDETKVRPEIAGKSYDTVRKEMDLIGYYHMVNNRRVLDFNPTDKWVGKNCTKFESIVDPNMATILSEARTQLTESNQQQTEILEKIGAFLELLQGVDNVEKLNDFADAIKKEENPTVRDQIKFHLSPKVKALNAVYSKEEDKFITSEKTE